MLNVVNCVVFACYFVVERLPIAILDIVLQSRKHAAFGLRLSSFRNHLEEHVNVHALVYIEEKGDASGWNQRIDVDFLELADCLDETLVLIALDGDLDVQNLVFFFVGDNGIGVHFFHQFDQVH